MFSFLEQLQHRPERSKRTITLAVSTVLTLVIFSIWLVSLYGRFSSPELVSTATESPFSALYENTKAGAQTIKSQFEELFKLLK